MNLELSALKWKRLLVQSKLAGLRHLNSNGINLDERFLKADENATLGHLRTIIITSLTFNSKEVADFHSQVLYLLSGRRPETITVNRIAFIIRNCKSGVLVRRRDLLDVSNGSGNAVNCRTDLRRKKFLQRSNCEFHFLGLLKDVDNLRFAIASQIKHSLFRSGCRLGFESNLGLAGNACSRGNLDPFRNIAERPVGFGIYSDGL